MKKLLQKIKCFFGISNIKTISVDNCTFWKKGFVCKYCFERASGICKKGLENEPRI